MAHVNMPMLCYHYSKQQNKSAWVSVYQSGFHPVP